MREVHGRIFIKLWRQN